jgi:hypothetical protein
MPHPKKDNSEKKIENGLLVVALARIVCVKSIFCAPFSFFPFFGPHGCHLAFKKVILTFL